MDTRMKNNRRIRNLDILKGIAIILVIYGHLIANKWQMIVIWSFHMPLFIFISGYCYSEKNFKALIQRNARTYLLPYIYIWGGIFAINSVVLALTMHSDDIVPYLKQWVISGVFALASNSTLNKPAWIMSVGASWFLVALFDGMVFLWLVQKNRLSNI